MTTQLKLNKGLIELIPLTEKWIIQGSFKTIQPNALKFEKLFSEKCGINCSIVWHQEHSQIYAS